MKASSIARVLSACALLTFAASTAGAQTATQTGSSAAASSTPWAALPVGTYKLDILEFPDGPLVVTVVIRDSSGVAIATLQPGDDPAEPVRIAVKGEELTINGVAGKGPYELVLRRQADVVTGRWTYGGDKGAVKGTAEK